MGTPALSIVLNCLVKRIRSLVFTGVNLSLIEAQVAPCEFLPSSLTLDGINPRSVNILVTISRESASITLDTVLPLSFMAWYANLGIVSGILFLMILRVKVDNQSVGIIH